MLGLDLHVEGRRTPRILFVGSHADDIEIGCGATAAALLRRYPRAKICWLVLSASPLRRREARRAVRLLLGSAIEVDLRLAEFKESHFPSQVAAIKACVENVKTDFDPQIVFSHYSQDLHQDHRVVSEVTWNTFRNHLILEYEIPKYDGGLGSPSVFVPITRTALTKKTGVLMKAFGSQLQKQWFTPETFVAMARIRGIECNSPTGYAEAFYARKLQFQLSGP